MLIFPLKLRGRYFVTRIKKSFFETDMSRKETNQLVANLWISHFNEKNLDSLLELYADDAGKN